LSRRVKDGRSFSILSRHIGGSTCGVTMPSLFRFVAVVGVLGGLTFGAMFALATWYDPKPREITISIPPDKFSKQR
jgi:hypothetical protein